MKKRRVITGPENFIRKEDETWTNDNVNFKKNNTKLNRIKTGSLT